MSRQDKAKEELWTMLEQEASSYIIKFDYLAAIKIKNDGAGGKDELTEGFRRLVCGWLFEVVDHFNYDRDIAAIATYYIDQTTAIQMQKQDKTVQRREYQLIGVTSLYLAIKLHGGHEDASRPDIQSFANLSNSQFSVKEIEGKELEMLTMMDWHLNPPSSSRVVVNLIYFIPEYWEEDETSGGKSSKAEISSIFEVSRYLTELSLHVSEIFFKYKSSEIAFAAVVCAMDALKDKLSLPRWVREDFISNVTDSTNLTLKSALALGTLLNDLFHSVHSPNGCHESSPPNGKDSPVSVRDV
mmetsp:Transcript_1599/g.2200  ORF Transcript_1599/g.2200 Transcript_1599/m.2200 type:complete len:299 (-) Transcript_1599:99-995(-)